MAEISSRMATLNPFSNSASEEDDDRGEEFGVDSVGGGGRSNRRTEQDEEPLRVSHALQTFLAKHGVMSDDDVSSDARDQCEVLRKMLGKTSFTVPDHLLVRSHPLPEYFISSSHNTYLMAHQLYGTSSAKAYETALRMGSRCVEIDAWDNSNDPDEPKVTHGYTFVSHIPFRAVCETIRQAFDEEIDLASRDPDYPVAPILLSLENHCEDHGQLRLVQIMKDVFGDRLLSEAVRREGHREQEGSGEHVTLAELGPRITVIVEYHIPGEANYSDSFSDDSSSAEEEGATGDAARDKKGDKPVPCSVIMPELAELGVYAQSIKPTDNSWYDVAGLLNGPHHHLINVSESGLSKHLPANAAAIAKHNAHHLMRVYPKGTRISSSNLKPVAFWGIGAQICALNWQSFGTSNQLNDALFSGSDGYVLKPAALRAGGNGKLGTGRMKRLRLHAAGATGIPLHEDREADSIKPYLTCNLYSPCPIEGDTFKRKTSPYKHHRLGMLHRGENPPAIDPVWDETLEWVYEENELVFLRMLIKSDDAWAKNPMIAAAAVRLLYAEPGWTMINMMDMKGGETGCTVLVKFTIEDA
ncbi:phosphatidylinositol-specific phospholipase c, X domain-containing protein [Hirsutella rhossiliensis]|uniref:Phosphoinositide phospholipase C n=1 Tax=Hirsutella rhossiliensis TaxID=111463 RepID=A0A9P8MWZ0_9HYPO|nr:phosphatidylinositol-specific phospholipase c, X domain-containing protein [Hirsutella rhossiliensis]KAH0962709.1 phosphatidylinositol-specific phospholipase c, X domain-containing protein [Hirsutella rhossiliensis]